MNFKDFKKNSSALKDSLTKLAATPTNSYADDRFWSVTKDSTGNGSALFRFLPQQDPSLSPIILTFRHAFQKEGRWFIEECPYTIGEKCPVCEYSSSIWNSNEDEARKYWRTKTYIANIYVISDEANKENEGKVFLYKFGKKIYDVLMDRIAPDDEEGVNVFDFDEGLDFKLKLGQKAGYNNYDRSTFAFKSTPLADGDLKAQEVIYNSIYSLDEFMKPDRFKSYDELLKKLTNSNSASKVPDIQSDFVKETVKKPVYEEKEDSFIPEDSNTNEEDIDFASLLDD